MTKKELGKKATAYALEWGDKTDGTYACCRDGYLAAAEPREKRIAELEKACDETQELLNKQIEATYKVVEKLNKAKKIIDNLYAICKDNHYPDSSVLMEQAEQFLEEE